MDISRSPDPGFPSASHQSPSAVPTGCSISVPSESISGPDWLFHQRSTTPKSEIRNPKSEIRARARARDKRGLSDFGWTFPDHQIPVFHQRPISVHQRSRMAVPSAVHNSEIRARGRRLGEGNRGQKILRRAPLFLLTPETTIVLIH